ncbi:TetR family transcriptional regulator [Cryptosporangium sp. NPDC051539]|uniref:TetR/AcrR family transcriptional regulator n=1 Tax=Cryptosporangium sp. NPDC051539 TaxID=3363962 RepID=UPI0037921969
MLPTTSKGTATRRRILDAATGEFAERGIAGARIDRITAAARTNKAQLYGYFGSKDGLFDAVVTDCIEHSTTEIPFDADDLPGWAVAVYDGNLRNPHLVRLLTWSRLERRTTGLLIRDFEATPKLAAIATRQAGGRLRAGDPADLLVMVLGMACAWSPSSSAYTASFEEPSGDHERRREFLRESVERAVAP